MSTYDIPRAFCPATQVSWLCLKDLSDNGDYTSWKPSPVIYFCKVKYPSCTPTVLDLRFERNEIGNVKNCDGWVGFSFVSVSTSFHLQNWRNKVRCSLSIFYENYNMGEKTESLPCVIFSIPCLLLDSTFLLHFVFAIRLINQSLLTLRYLERINKWIWKRFLFPLPFLAQ